MADVGEAASTALSGTASEPESKTGSTRESEGVSEMECRPDGKTEGKRASDIYSSSPSLLLIPDSHGDEYSGEELERAARTVAKACHWVRRNPEKWAALKGICRRLMMEGELIQRGSVYERARQYGVDVRLLSQFKRDHNLWSVLTRYMAMERPSMLSAISFRVTPVDRVDLAAYWRDIVGADEFTALSLAEARAAYNFQRGVR